MSEDIQQPTVEQQAVAEAQAERTAEAAEFEAAIAAGNAALGGAMAKLAAEPQQSLSALAGLEEGERGHQGPQGVSDAELAADRNGFPEKIQRPSIGRVVHAIDVINGERRIRKADICFVWSDDSVNLDITNHDGTHSVAEKVGYKEQEEGAALGWEWPARV